MRHIFTTLALIIISTVAVRSAEQEVQIPCSWGNIAATLATPDTAACDTAAIIIAGSGPTDRNGNSGLNLNTYAYKMLSDELIAEGIATLRYDKRAIGGSYYPAEEVPNVIFDDFVADARDCISYLKTLGYKRIVIIGHSEGGDIALHLALDNDDTVVGIVLLSAAGYPVDRVLCRQLAQQLVPANIALYMQAEKIIRRIKGGEQVPIEEIPAELLSLFHPSVQPYLISWMDHDPAELMAQSTTPTLIISGGHDIQVLVSDAERLAEAGTNATHVSFPNMSHVLKDCDTTDRIAQLMSVYTNAQHPLTEGLSSTIANFINNL
ncbi:MAG: alpha/beta fold hydrolase [Alistipes sp.]|nr:alpha/beta fold hydrolase [Alistipes sp.]